MRAPARRRTGLLLGDTTGLNAIYDTITGTWSRPTDIDFPVVPMQAPNHYAVKDGPASLLPNGNILVMASPVDSRPRATSTFPATSTRCSTKPAT